MRRERVLAAALVVHASGCYVVNESYQAATEGDSSSTDATAPATTAGTSAGTAASTSGSETTTDPSGAASSPASTTEPASTTATTSAGATGSDATSTDATTADVTSTSTSTTGGGAPPGLYTVPATIATCVLLDNGSGFGPPAVCSANADAQNGTSLTGLMMVDTAVNNLDGYGRPAHSFLRFDVPAEYAGLTVAAATLHVQVADGSLADGPQSGTLVVANPFDVASLQSGPPGVGQPLVGDQGAVAENQWITWTIPPAMVLAGQPVHLALLPTYSDGIFLRGAEPGAPYLELLLQ